MAKTETKFLRKENELFVITGVYWRFQTRKFQFRLNKLIKCNMHLKDCCIKEYEEEVNCKLRHCTKYCQLQAKVCAPCAG